MRNFKLKGSVHAAVLIILINHTHTPFREMNSDIIGRKAANERREAQKHVQVPIKFQLIQRQQICEKPILQFIIHHRTRTRMKM